jgi:hypothetical protein
MSTTSGAQSLVALLRNTNAATLRHVLLQWSRAPSPRGPGWLAQASQFQDRPSRQPELATSPVENR